jgi:hypothetical protein
MEKIFNISKRYILKILPDEAKDAKKTRKGLISNDEQVHHPSEDDEKEGKKK